jgi:cation:H+ antiporter
MLFFLLNIALFVASVYLIMVGSDWITDSSVHVARRIGTSNLAMGLIVISVLMSFPELIIAVSSIVQGHPSIGFGASIGSVIVNIGLIIGVSALIRPLRVPRIMVTRDMIFMTVVSIVVVAMALDDGYISRVDGFVFLLLFVPYVINVYEQERNLTSHERRAETNRIVETLETYGDFKKQHHIQAGPKYFIYGFALLFIGSEIFLETLLNVVSYLSLPELLVGVTIGAIGPSLPTLAGAVGAARKGIEELVISETIGSNIFTLLITIGIIAILSPMAMDKTTTMITAPALLMVTFVLLFMMMRGHIRRWEGLLLVMMYAAIIIAHLMFGLYIARGSP